MGDAKTSLSSYLHNHRLNRGRARVVSQLEAPIKVHRSVKLRIQDPNLKYVPRVKFEREPVWVD